MSRKSRRSQRPNWWKSGSAGGAGTRPRSEVTLPHPPGPGLSVPRTRLWIKRPPGPAGL